MTHQKPSSIVHAMPKFLLFGKTGWIGGLLGDILRHQGHEYAYAEARLEDRRSILDELLKVG